MKLDQNSENGQPRIVWGLIELQKAAKNFQQHGDHRSLLILALGGFMGLRPTEISRIRIEDGDGDWKVLKIGQRIAKNKSSRRDLPVPTTITRWIKQYIKQRDPAHRAAEYPLLLNRFKNTCELTTEDLCHYFNPRMEQITKKKLTVKSLRKSFMDWTIKAKLDRDRMEQYTGHKLSGVMPITERFYLADIMVSELKPFANQLEKRLKPKIKKQASKPRKTGPKRT